MATGTKISEMSARTLAQIDRDTAVLPIVDALTNRKMTLAELLKGVTCPGISAASAPVLTIDEEDYSLSLPSTTVILYDNDSRTGMPAEFTVPAIADLATVDGGLQAIVVDYNGGSPIYKIVDNSDGEAWNLSDTVPIYDIWRVGTTVHSSDYDAMALATLAKLVERMLHIRRYARESGVVISEETSPAARTIALTSGGVYKGMMEVGLDAFISSTNNLFETWWDGSTWHYDVVTQYDNTYYNGASGKVAATNTAKWLVRWFYRSVGDAVDMFYLLGTDEYISKAAAEAAEPRADLPPVLNAQLGHCVLVGRAVIQKTATSGTTVGMFDMEFSQGVEAVDFVKLSLVEELPTEGEINVIYATGTTVG